jgi:transposase
MEMVDGMAGIEFEDVGLRVTRVLRNGRRRYDAASKERLVSACLHPGSSILGLALAHGVNANLLRKWVGKRLADGPASGRSFVPVHFGGAECAGAFSDVIDGGVVDAIRHDDGVGDRTWPVAAPDGGDSCGAARAVGVTHVTAWLPNGVKVVLDCGGSGVGAVLGALAHVPSGR